MVREALETDESLTAQQIQLNDQNEGKTKLALWSNPGDGTLGSLTRSRRVVETVEQMLGGPILHYHSKNLVKYPEEGGVWNWHQVRASSNASRRSSRASLAQRQFSLVVAQMQFLQHVRPFVPCGDRTQDYGYWYKDFFLTPDMLTAYFAIDRQTMENGCACN